MQWPRRRLACYNIPRVHHSLTLNVTLVSQGESVQNPSNLKIRRNAICGGFSPSRGDYTPIKLKYGMEEFTHTPNLARINKRGWVKELQNLKKFGKSRGFFAPQNYVLPQGKATKQHAKFLLDSNGWNQEIMTWLGLLLPVSGVAIGSTVRHYHSKPSHKIHHDKTVMATLDGATDEWNMNMQ